MLTQERLFAFAEVGLYLLQFLEENFVFEVYFPLSLSLGFCYSVGLPAVAGARDDTA